MKHLSVLFADVAARRILELGARRLRVCADGARGDALGTRVSDEPTLPCGPPGARLCRRALEPLIARQRVVRIVPGAQAKRALRVGRPTHDPGIVTAARQKEAVVLGPSQAAHLIDRTP